MDKPKICIVIEGGLVQSVISNQDIEYVLVDYDNVQIDENLIENSYIDINVMEQDLKTDNIWSCFDGIGIDRFVKKSLQKLNF